MAMNIVRLKLKLVLRCVCAVTLARNAPNANRDTRTVLGIRLLSLGSFRISNYERGHCKERWDQS